MGFWKSLFVGSDGAASGETGGSGTVLESVPEYREGCSIVFSTDRDIDLYELEELCSAVGWARRPIRKVKKAIQHSYFSGDHVGATRTPSPPGGVFQGNL